MNYYNENDPRAAAWLRELIKTGEIPGGVVDERSITEVQPHELANYTQCHFFAGVGGWSFALQLAGWPATRPVGTGSCPCQPFSDAGLGLGTGDPRHLWPAFFRLIAECRALGQRWTDAVLGEQVASKDALEWLDRVFADLESEGYTCGASDLCSAGVGSPNIRQRLYWVANAPGQRFEVGVGESVEANGNRNESERRRISDGLVDSVQSRLEGHTGDVADRNESGRDRADSSGPATEAGRALRLGDATGGGCGERGDATQSEGSGYADSASLPSHWSRFEIAWCRDPRGGDPIPRRIEPGSFPMAARLPSRVGLLRGYGNAINPYVAAEFIQAFVEAVA